MSLAICQHVKPGGEACGSPALRDHNYCYYHVGLRKAVPTTTMFVRANPYRKDSDPYAIFDLPFLEDAAAIQIGFMQLIQAVAGEEIDVRRAKLILSALHGAAANLRKMDAALAKCEAAAKGNRDEADGAEAGPSAPGRRNAAPLRQAQGDRNGRFVEDGAPAHPNDNDGAKKQPTSVGAGAATERRTG